MATDGRLPVAQIDGLDAAIADSAGSDAWWPGTAPLVDYAFDAAGSVLEGSVASHVAFPNALTLRSGKQLVFFRASSSHAVDTATAAVKGRSRASDTAAWSSAYTVLDTASVDDHTGGLAQLRDGTVVALICERPSSTSSGFYTVCIRSTNDGATFGTPVTVDAGYTAMSFASDLVTLPDGTLLASLYGTDGGDDYAVVAHSVDGTAWSRRAVVAQATGQDWQEPRLVVMPDGEILCFLRYESGTTYRIYMARSVDLGKTWTTPVQILTAAGGMPGPHLTRNNMLVLTYRDKSGSDAALWASSIDRGNTWTLRGSLSGASDRYVYADWLDLGSGDIAAVYALENPPNGNSSDLYIRKLDRSVTGAVAGPPAIEDVTHSGSEGDYVSVVGGVLTTVPPPTFTASTHWEAWLAGTPPEPLLTPDGTDWIYVEVPN